MKLFALTISVFVYFALVSQENFGINMSNYSPTTSLHLNPSSIVDSWTYLDVNLVGLAAYANNNGMYLEQNSIWGMTKQNSDIQFESNTSNRKKDVYADVMIHGPSVSLVKDKYAFALSTSVKSYTDVRNVPLPYFKYMLNNLQIREQFNIDYDFSNMRMNSLTYAEFALSYGQILMSRGNEMLTGGINIKRLIGINGVAVRVDRLAMNVNDSSTAYFEQLDGEIDANIPQWNSGSGWGMDIGLTFKKTENYTSHYIPHNPQSNCEPIRYKYKVGVSLLDVGSVKFKSSEISGNLSASDFNWESYDTSTFNYETIETNFGSDISSNESFKMSLPSAVSLQFDYAIKPKYYIAGVWVHNLNLLKNYGPRRANMINVTPRYESKHFEASLSISLYEYTRPQVGIAFRFYNLIIGSDKVFPFLFKSNHYGADFYMNLKLYMLKSRKCKEQTPKSYPSGRKIFQRGRKKKECDAFH